MTNSIGILAEPGTIVSDALVPPAITGIRKRHRLSLEFVADVRAKPASPSYIADIARRWHPKEVVHRGLRRLAGRPTPTYPDCRAWAMAPHTPSVEFRNVPDPNTASFINDCHKLDALLLLGCSHILSTDLLEVSGLEIINFHWSYLPEYGGRYVTFWAPYEGATEHGITYHTIAEEVDEGKALIRERIPIQAGNTTLQYDCLTAGRNRLPDVLERLEAGDLEPLEELPESDLYYASEYETHEFGFNASMPPQEISRRVRAKEELPVTNGSRTGLVTGFEIDGEDTTADDGRIVGISRDGVRVALDGGVGRITSLYYFPARVVALGLGWREGDRLDSV